MKSRHRLLHRATALVLSWVFLATTVWAAAPPAPVVTVPRGTAIQASGPLTPVHLAEPKSALDVLMAAAKAQAGQQSPGGEATPRGPFAPEGPSFASLFGAEATEAGPSAEASAAMTVLEANPSALDATLSLFSDEPHSGGGNHGNHGDDGDDGDDDGDMPPPPPLPSCPAGFWGPHRYVRTCGPRNVYTTSVTPPSWVSGPYLLRIQNGETGGAHRVSSAWIEVGGASVAGPSDFSQNVAYFDREVALTGPTALRVTLASAGGSFLTLRLCGRAADATPPQVSVVTPAPGSTTSDRTPRFLVRYQDLPGPGESGASGVKLSTFRFTLDGVDRSSLFCKRPTEASANLPESLALAEGLHQVHVEIKDRAGNLGQTDTEFRVDKTRPTVSIVEPPSGGYLSKTHSQIRVSYADESGLDLDTLQILVNGHDKTALFSKGASEAVATVDASWGLASGGNQIVAEIKDLAGNSASASRCFRVDLTPPQIVIGQPQNGSSHGTSEVEVIVQYSDDQALNLASFTAKVDGAAVSLGQGPEGAMGRVGPLADGGHGLVVTIQDAAGNLATASVSFSVETQAPVVEILQPPPGFTIRDATPHVLITYRDDQSVDLSSFKVFVNGVEQTSLFTVGADAAEATLPVALPDGENTITAEIRDNVGHRTEAVSRFWVDTLPPTGQIDEPGSITRNPTPSVVVTYADPGTAPSGVDPASVRVFIDGQDRTDLFAIGSDRATGVLQLDPPLADGLHTVRVALADRAGNVGEITGSFTLDTVPPQLTVTAPALDAFTNDPTPSLRVVYPDPDGVGARPDTLRVYLKRGDEPEVEITPYFTAGASEALGVVPDASALSDATYHLRAEVEDRAGNLATVTSTFDVDTVAPTYSVPSPADTAFVPTTTPSFRIRYQDDRSGVDTEALVFMIDGVKLTQRLTREANEAYGTLLPEDALAQGRHVTTVRVTDRAGNQALPVPHSFVVDTVPPTAQVDAPADGTYSGTPLTQVRVTYTDAGSAGNGVDPATVKVFVDGVERTAEFTITATAAEAALATPLGDGNHVVEAEVKDWAANRTPASSHATVDTQAPIVSISQPAEGSYHRQSPVTVSGTVLDTDPQVVVEAQVGTGAPIACTVSAGSFTCSVPLAEGENPVVVTARDRLAREGHDGRTLRLDTTPPLLEVQEPIDHQIVGSEPLTVRGLIQDASPLTVRVGDTWGAVTGISFVIPGVPVGTGPDVTLTVLAEDAAGNQTERTLHVHVDNTAPAVHITSPSANVYLRTTPVVVTGTVSDEGPVAVYVNGQEATATAGNFAAQVPAADGRLTLEAMARDAGGNEARESVEVTVDTVPPVINVAPTPPVTNATSLDISGSVQDLSPVTLTLDGAAVDLSAGSFSRTVAIPAEISYTFHLLARDAAENEAVRDVSVRVDRQGPTLEIVSPAAGAPVGALPLVVRGLASDAGSFTVTVDGQPATLTQGAWEAVVSSLPEGTHTLTVVARDEVGNQTEQTREVVVDLGPPQVTIGSPSSGLLTRQTAVTVTGTVVDQTQATVTLNGVPASVTWNGNTGSFTAAGVPLVEGDNRLLALATDTSGRTATAEVIVTRDTTPPLLDLAAPDRLRRGETASVTAGVTDSSAIASVVLRLEGQTLGTFATPPYTASFSVPPGAAIGSDLTLTGVATDAAGNEGTASRLVRVGGSGGAVVGQVLRDDTGLPLPGATVRLFAGQTQADVATTDERGRYSFAVNEESARVRVEKSGFTSAVREVSVAAGVGTVVVDARLLPLAAARLLDGSGGELQAGLVIRAPAVPPAGAGTALAVTVKAAPPLSAAQVIARRYAAVRAAAAAASSTDITVQVPAGAVWSAANFRLTSLSAQGLPALLPLGFSPLVALDLREDSGQGVSLPLPLAVSGLSATTTSLHLVQYQEGLRGWVLLAADVPVSSGALSTVLPQVGIFALVSMDTLEPPLVLPAVNQPLPGAPVLALPLTATAAGVVEPAVIPPTFEVGVEAAPVASLIVTSPVKVPSGTVVSAEVSETYRLSSGETASEESRLEDLLLYGEPGAATTGSPGTSSAATFPVAPSRRFEGGELQSGTVNLDIRAGRESVRGETGGSDAVQVQSGPVTLSVPAGALPQNTAITVEPVVLDDWLPQTASLVVLGEVELDLSGQTLSVGAQLALETTEAQATDTLLIAKVERVLGVAKLVVVSLGSLQAGRVVTVSYPGLAGIVTGGRYVFYRLTAAMGFVGGTTTAASGGGAVRAVVSTSTLPFVGLSAADGAYLQPALAGTNRVEAMVPGTSLTASVPGVEVVTGQTTPLNLALEGTVTSAVVRPQNGLTGVSPTVQIEIEAETALLPSTVTTDNVKLYKVATSGETEVSVRLVLSGSRKLLAVIPQQALAYSTLYRLAVTGLADAYGGLVGVPATQFRIKDNVPPVYDLTKLVFSFPDENGMVHLTAAAGTFLPGTRILVINAGNGIVASYTADNDGALQGELPASLDDRLLITITDPMGNITNIERSQYFDPATGMTAVGAGGGVIAGDGGVELRIPEGALERSVPLKLSLATQDDFPQLPELGPDTYFGAAIKIESSERPTFTKPLQLVFPKPADAPLGDSTYYNILKKVAGPNGITVYEAIGIGDLEQVPYPPGTPDPPPPPTYRVVTQNLPVFRGWRDSEDELPGASHAPQKAAKVGTSLLYDAWYGIVMRTFYELLPGRPLPGMITGKVLRVKWGSPGDSPQYEPIEGAYVTGTDSGGFAVLSPGGSFARSGADGSFALWDSYFVGGSFTVEATVNGVVRSATAFQMNAVDTHNAGLGRYNAARASIIFPAQEPPPPPPQVAVRLFKLVDEARVEILGGLVVEDTPLLITLKPSNPDLRILNDGLEINGSSTNLGVVPDPQEATAYVVQDSSSQAPFLFVPGNVGSYALKIKVMRGINPEPFYMNYTFRAVTAGGGVDVDLDNPPGIIDARTLPKNSARGVPVGVTPQVSFTEPVTMVKSSVFLDEVGGATVPLKLIGIDRQGQVIPDVTDQSEVTAITVQPLVGLKFLTQYQLRVTTGLADLDAPAKNLAQEYVTGFETFGPEDIGAQSDSRAIAGMAALGDIVYAAETHYRGGISPAYQDGWFWKYDLSDPTEPKETSLAYLYGPPSDLAIEPTRKLVAISMGNKTAPVAHPDGYTEILSSSSNVFLYDVTEGQPERWVGAVSMTNGLLDGMVQRVALKGDKVYTATWRKGIQIVDVDTVIGMFQPPTPTNLANYAAMMREMSVMGHGWGLENVVTIPVQTLAEPRRTVNLWDIQAADVNYQGVVQTLVFATGASQDGGLVIAHPASNQVVKQMAARTITSGYAVEVTTLAGKPIALVAGVGIGGGLLCVFDLSPLSQNPAGNPVVLSSLVVGGWPTDIVMSGNTAIVAIGGGKAELVDLTTPSNPRVTGELSSGIGTRLALTGSNLLVSTYRTYLANMNNPLQGLHVAALGEVALIKAGEAFPVSRARKSLAPKDVRFQLIPPDKQVTSAKLELYANDALQSTVSPVPGATSYTYPEGSAFDADVRYQVRLVLNEGEQGELKSPKKTMRPARFEIPETAEVEIQPGKDAVEVVKLFQSAPDITLTFKQFGDLLHLGAGENVGVLVEGTVTSAIAPIEKIVVNEEVVTVVQTGTGSNDLGPFTGKYVATAMVGPQPELVTAYAVDALNHASTQSLGVYPRERIAILGVIPGRDIVPFDPLVPGPTDSSSYRFRITLKDKGNAAATTNVEVEAGGQRLTMKLKREGEVYVSDPLLALPENLRLPSGASDAMKNSRLKVTLASGIRMTFGEVKDRALVAGVVLKAGGTGPPSELVDPGSGMPYVVEVGAPGTDGASLTAMVTSLTAQMQAVEAGDHPTSRSVTVTRTSADPSDPGFNVYRGNEGVIPLMDGVTTTSSGLPQRVLALGRLKVEQGTASLTLPVGAGADAVEWLTEEVTPRYEDGILDVLLSFLIEPALPKIWEVRQSAKFLRGDTALPGLRVSGFLDRRTAEVNERTGITALHRNGPGDYVPTSFPQVTDSEGRIFFRVKAFGVDQGSSRPLAGVVLALNDVVGIRAMGLLGTGGAPPTLPAATNVASVHKEPPRRTPIVAGYATVGGIPRRHNEWYRAVAKLLVEQVVGDDAELQGIKGHLAAGLEANGVVFTPEQLEEYYTYFMLGAIAGFPRGAVGAFKDSVVGVFELVGSAGPVLKLMAPVVDSDASPKRMILNMTLQALPGGVLVAKGILAAEYLQEHREKLRKLLPILQQAARFIGREEVQVQLTGYLLKQFMANYDSEIAKVLQLLGVDEGTVAFRGIAFGYSVGALGGYITEFVAELFTLGLVGEGVGAALPVMLKAARTGTAGARVANALSKVTRVALAGGDTGKFAKGFRFLIKFLDALGPGVLERWIMKVAEVPEGPERTMMFLFKLGERDLVEAEQVVTKLAKGFSGDGASGILATENVADAVVSLSRMVADSEYRGARSLVLLSADEAEDFARGLGRAVDVSKAEPQYAAGFEGIFKNVEDADEFFVSLAGAEDDAFRAAARLACPR